MGGIKPYEFRASSNCLERTQLFERKDSDLLSRRLHPDHSWQFSRRFRRSMRIFHRSKISRQSRWIYNDAISPRHQYRIGPRTTPARKDFRAYCEGRGRACLYKHYRGGRIALWDRQEKFFTANCTARSRAGCHGCARARGARRRRIWRSKSRPGASRPANWRKRPANSRSRTNVGPYSGNR